MLDQEKVKSIYRRGAEEKWSYPQVFNALKNIGIERYETNVLTHEIKYVGGGTAFIEPGPEGFKILTAGTRFKLDALKLALGRIQRAETNYIQFLGEIAAAGVSFYRVDMGPRTVTYHGPGREKYVEKVPEPGTAKVT